MNRSLLNLLIDLVAAVCLLIMIATGYVLRFPLPPTTNRTHELWGLSRHEWGIMHSWASLGLLAVLFVHVALHWEWIFAMVRRRFTRATQAGPTRPVRAEIITMTTLLALVGMFAWAAMGRLAQPSSAQGGTIMVVAAVGIMINASTALLFMRGREHDLNIRGAFLHMMADAIVSAGVVVAGALALWKGWDWLDPVVSLIIVAVILAGTWGLFHQSLHLLFDGVPFEVDSDAVRQYLEALPGVRQVHDLHIWAISTSQIALTAHLVMPAGHPDDVFLQDATQGLRDRFEIDHVTLQVMRAPFSQPCEEASSQPASTAKSAGVIKR